MKRLLRLQFVLLLVMMLGITASWAQVSFTVDAPSPVSVGESFLVEFTVDSEPDSNSFVGPDFKGFDVIAGPSTAVGHSMQFINGKQSSSYHCTYTYLLIAREKGKFNIGSASIDVNGKRYKTKALPIEVLETDAAPNNASPNSQITKDNIMLRWVLSDSEIYKGEAIRASLVLYYDVPIYDCQELEIGTFYNFWSQNLSIHNPKSRIEYNNRIYETYKFSDYMLIPQSDGTIELPEASITAVAVVVTQSHPANIFYNGMEEFYIPRLIKTEPTVVNVKPYPEGAPASFKGAVGNFRMTSQCPKGDININSADEVSITITGSGNFNFITAPKFTMPESFEQYDIKIEENIQNSNNGMSGSVTYRYPFVARATGEYELAPIEFTYFDPTLGEYKSLTTEPITLSVINDGSVALPTYSYDGSTSTPTQRQEFAKDIRYIKTEKMPYNEPIAMFMFSDIYWAIVSSIVIIFILIFVVMRQRIRANRNVVMRRMKHADKVAIQRLKSANQYMKQGVRHAFYEEILRAMWGYISDKFNIPVSNLTKETIREELTSRGMSEAEAEQFCTIISRADEAQYAPGTEGDMNAVYGDAIDIISKIESVVKKSTMHHTSHNIIIALIATSIAFVGSTTSSYAQHTPKDEIWQRANNAYDEGLYDEAIDDYNSLIHQGVVNEYIYYNLGNAYFKRGLANVNSKGYGFNNGELGRAILNYERALKIDPSMEDAQYNLEMANKYTEAPEALPVNFMTSIWRGLADMATSNTWCIISLVALLVSMSLVLVYLLSTNRAVRIATFFLAIFTIIIFITTTCLAISQRSAQMDDSRAVIICNDTQNIYSEPKKRSTHIRTHRQGVVVTILGTGGKNNEWTEVKFADGEKGWIVSEAVERI